MKHYIYKITILVGLSLFITSCSINDPVNDLGSIGKETPSVYWEQVSSSVVAGEDAKFELQYFPMNKEASIRDLQVWYNIYSTVNISATCPIVSSFTYTVAEDTVETVREFVPVIGYAHQESNWNEEKRTYFITGTFPTTYTLAPTTWNNVEKFDQEKFTKYFPADFAKSFRDSVYSKMKVADFRKVFVVTNPRIPEKSFNNYIDSVFDDPSGRMVYSVKPEFVEYFKTEFYSIPYDSLFYDSSTSMFKIEYEKRYTLGAKFKVTDSKGVSNFSEEKSIGLR